VATDEIIDSHESFENHYQESQYYEPDNTQNYPEETDEIPEINIDSEVPEENIQEEHQHFKNIQENHHHIDDVEAVHHDKIPNGCAVIIDDVEEESAQQDDVTHPEASGAENTAFDDNFGQQSFTESKEDEKLGWATFDDEKSFEFSTFLSNEEQNRLLLKPQSINTNNEIESFDASSSWEPSFQQRSQSTDPSRQNTFDPFANRPGTEPPKEWDDAWNDNSTELLNKQSDIDEAFPSSASISQEKSQNSLKVSNDSIFNSSPFTDNFCDKFERVTSPHTQEYPPINCEGTDRVSNLSRQSAQSGEYVDTSDVFDENSFSNFKIKAKTASMTNSDSVDIFKVSADPFDDDFFK